MKLQRILLDVNVILDVLLDRGPHAGPSGLVWSAVERGRLEGMIAGHALTTIHNLIRRQLGASRARQAVKAMLKVFRVAAVDGEAIARALDMDWPDFEDAVSAAAAERARCDAIVARDPKGFRRAPMRVLSPAALAGWLARH